MAIRSKKTDETESSSPAIPYARVILYVGLIFCVILGLISNTKILKLMPGVALLEEQKEYAVTTTDTATATATATNRATSTSTSTAAPPLLLPKGNKYDPSSSEKYIVEHATELGYASEKNPSGCNIYKENNTETPAATKELRDNLMAFDADMDRHTRAIQQFKAIPDLMKSIHYETNTETNTNNNDNLVINHDICATARPHPDGLAALFTNTMNMDSNSDSDSNSNGGLSFTPTSGYVEPLLPPMRNPKICYAKEGLGPHFMDLEYLVHDFEFMCRNLKPNSKRIFIDMGASLSFHGSSGVQPVVSLLELYEKFGFHFDHIYGFEITFTDPKLVYTGGLLPEKYLHNYHWINAGVNHTEGHRMNPLHSILSKFDEDDFVVVKLDIDTGWIEVPLARQLLEDKNNVYHKLIDQFYFEHHVHLGELARSWKKSMDGTIQQSLELFYGLRQKGIPAHFWP